VSDHLVPLDGTTLRVSIKIPTGEYGERLSQRKSLPTDCLPCPGEVKLPTLAEESLMKLEEIQDTVRTIVFGPLAG
jgi:hypothetical protein